MINPTLQTKLEHLLERHEDLQALLSEPEIIAKQQQYRELTQEYAQLEPLVKCYRSYSEAVQAKAAAELLLNDEDVELRKLAQEEYSMTKQAIETLEKDIEVLLLPTDPNDKNNVFLEIRAGTGGDEAAIFAGDLCRMYTRYAENRGWSVEMVSASYGEHGGFKEVILRIIGQGIYGQLKFESGAHRVQRVPLTESQGRIHTSACTVAVLPELEEIDAITINPSELKIDTFRASGAGGQHVNKTDSAIRITHLPTGLVVECQDERSQHKNRARAMSILQAKLLAQEQEKQRSERDATRKSLVGSGDRSERIRTYNYPQSRVTDHRINLTLYKLSSVMEGDLDEIIQPLIHEHQAYLLEEISGNNNA